MAESTTMSGMTDDKEPASLGAALAPFRQRLRDMGLEPGEPTIGPTPVQREDPEDAVERQRVRLAVYALRWQALVPAMYREASTDDLEEHQHAVAVRSWLGSGSLHLVLVGAVGTGKTHAAYGIGNQALERGLWVEAWNVGDLMDALRPGSSDRHAEDRARRCHLLILDDLIAKATDWEAERLQLILDARVRENRRTIVTTNATGEQVEATWGGRFMDRLRYRMTTLTFTGKSRRTSWT